MTFFSILLPSKNGENYIENVIKSILDQSFDDYEIIIGDNNNSKIFNDKIKKFNNKKIKVIRSETTLEVAQSWTNCLNNSSGRYIITLGDDDCLLYEGLNKIYNILKKNNFPECLSVNAISFFETNSSSEIQSTAYKTKFWSYKKYFLKKGFLSINDQNKIVRELFSFNNLLPLNMQPHVFTKKISELVKSGIFKPPSPDAYAIHSLLMQHKRWFISDEKIFAVGISQKSFGYFYHNNMLSEGKAFLGSKIDGDFINGSELNNYLYNVLENLRKFQPEIFLNFSINRSAYLSRQFFVCFEKFVKERNFKYIYLFFKNIRKKDLYLLIIGMLNIKLYFKGMYRVYYSLIQKNMRFKNTHFIKDKLNIYEFTRKYKF